jgi:hypothetical protein
VLIFTNYYTYYHTCRLQKYAQNLSTDADKFAVNQKVFAQVADIRSLFGYLVDHLGSKQALDPITKEDALWRIVEFFSRT